MAASPRHSTRPQAPPRHLALLEPLRAVHDALKRPRGREPLPFKVPRPVIVYPGLATNEFATSLLRRELAGVGHDVSDWGRGLNTGPQGDFDDWLQPLRKELARQASAAAQPVTLIGWSLGGVYARELAKLEPDSVNQVITLGTPHANLAHTNVGGLFDMLNRTRFTAPPGFALRLRQAPPVPTTSVYSRTDGIVAWKACRVPEGPRSQNLEVNDASHLGLVAHREVVYLIAERLLHAAGAWRRYGKD